MPGISLEPVATRQAPVEAQKVNLPEAVKKELKNERITYIALSVLTLGLYALGVFILDKIQAKWLNPLAFMPSCGRTPASGAHPDRIQIPTFDKVNLDATEVLCKKPTNKWLIYFCPNAGLYEDILFHQKVSKMLGEPGDDLLDPNKLGANILFFNYRGCGYSEGKLKGGTSLLLDGCAVVEHLKRKGIENHDIETFGFSIGGAVAPTVVQHYPGMKYFGDRAPASISDVVSAFATPLIGLIVKMTRFEINAFKAWKKIPEQDKAIIYHPKDGIIKKRASLYTAEKKLRKRQHPEWRVRKAGKRAWGLADNHKPRHVKLKDAEITPFRAHNRDYHPNEAKAIFAIAHQLLHS